jgi:hypothetical protein
VIHFGTLVCKCDVEGCKVTETFDNPKQYDSRILYLKAILKGWYLPPNGQQRCPRHHKEITDKAGIENMYGQPFKGATQMKKELEQISILENIPSPPAQ